MPYLCDLLFIFIFIMISLLILKSQEHRHTGPLAYHLEYILLFLKDNIDEECQRFSNSKNFNFNVLLSICFVFSKFQPGVAYKSFAYRVFQFRNSLPSDIKCNQKLPLLIGGSLHRIYYKNAFCYTGLDTCCYSNYWTD